MFRRLAVAAFGVVLALSGASAASASYPGKNGLIAFDRASRDLHNQPERHRA